MIYISIAENSLEIIQTAKNIFSREEKIVAVSRKVTTEKIITGEGVLNSDLLINTFNTALKDAYPAPIKDKKISLVIPDKDVFIQRFEMETTENISQSVIDKAKFTLPEDIVNYENFYKEIPGGVLFTAMTLKRISQFTAPFTKNGYDVIFLSSTAFPVYALLKLLLPANESLVYLNYSNIIQYILIDGNGPLYVSDKKTNAKTISADIKSIIKKIHSEHKLQPKSLVIAGDKSLDLPQEELAAHLEIPVHKISNVISEILISQKITLDTGGIPLLHFDKVLGLLNLSKMTDVPNFAVDLKNLSQSGFPTQTASPPEVVNEEQNVENVEPPMKVTVEEIDPDKDVASKTVPIVEETSIVGVPAPLKSGSSNQKLILVLFIAVALILFGGFILIGQGNNSISQIFSKVTPTPTISPSPTLTPVPTIDVSLNKSDISISVLNGTTKSGFAKETKEKLENLKYENITVGNADRDNYDKTVIKAKSDSQKYLPLVINDLGKTYENVVLETLPEDAKSDIEIILSP